MNKNIIWVLIAVLFIFSSYIVYERFQFEKKYNNVELILDYDEVLKKCAVTGADFTETLLKFKKAGITTIALNEETIDVLLNYGKISIIAQPPNASSLTPSVSFLINKEKAYIIDKTEKYLPNVKKIYQKLSNGDYILRLDASYVDISPYGLGFDGAAAKYINNLGFNLILRPKNKPNLTSDLLKKYWEEIKNTDNYCSISGVIFGGLENEVLGYPSLLSASVKELNDSYPIYFGVLEVAQSEKAQKGIDFVARQIPGNSVRVMSISDLYLAKLNPESVVEKFTLGVRERNIRWVYIHLFNASYSGRNVIDTNLKMVSDLRENLGGFNLAKVPRDANGYPSVKEFIFYLIFVLFAAMAFIIIAWFLIDDFIKTPVKVKLWLAALFILISIFLLYKKYFLYIQLIALGNAVLFTVLAFKMGIECFLNRIKGGEKEGAGFDFKHIFITFFTIVFITFTGALLVAALFSDISFRLNIYQFAGVKLLMILPPVVVFYWYLTKVAGKDYKEIFTSPITWGQGILLLVLLAAGVYYIIRTGNLGEGTALESEKSLRSYLGNLLIVRPRFKEIFFAHPALILGLSFIKDKKNYVLCALFLLFGAIGQADIIDTFAHAHTPVVISLIRFGWGILLGAVIGVIYWIIYKAFAKK